MKKIILIILTLSICLQAHTEDILIHNPKGNDSEPAFIKCRGRTGLIFLHSWKGSYTQHATFPLSSETAARNWSYISPNYRGSNVIYNGQYRLAREDIYQAYLTLKQRCNVNRVLIWGTSGGGYFTLLSLADRRMQFDRAVALAPMSDMHRWYKFHGTSKSRAPRFREDMKIYCDKNGEYSKTRCKNKSPITKDFTGVMTKVRILGSTEDRVNTILHSRLIRNKMRSQGVRATLRRVSGDHLFEWDKAFNFLSK